MLPAQNNIDAAVFTSYHNINYYSDFLYCSFGRPYALVVTQDAVVSISANIDGGQPWRRTVGTENIIYTDWQRDNYFVAIQQALPKAGRIGIEFDHLNWSTATNWPAVIPRPSWWTSPRHACACA